MSATRTPIATDSADELHNVIGDDATATFESDPKFVDSNPQAGASSENVEAQSAADEDDETAGDEGIDDDEDDEDEELEDEDAEDAEEEEDDEEDEDEDVEEEADEDEDGDGI